MILLFVALVAFLMLRVPIAYSLGLASLVYFGTLRPELLTVLPQRFFAGMDSYALLALPLFILMGHLMNESGITIRLINVCMVFVGRFPGGLGLVNVVASMLFGGISGSSASDTASIGSILIPEMQKRGYPREFAAGITVASSTMGMIIPPSIPMVIYAVTSQVSVGKLFLGGVIPGLLVGILQLGMVYRVAIRANYPIEERQYRSGEIGSELLRSIYVLLMPVFVVGSVVGGFATATESAGLGVLYAAVVGFLGTRHLTLDAVHRALYSTALTSAKIMMIIALSQVFIWGLAYERIPELVAGYVAEMQLPPTSLMLLMAGIVLAAGTFIDVSPAILLLTPVFLPAAVEAGVSPVLFGVVLVSGLAIGACTPPVGNGLNVCSAVSGLPIGAVFRGAARFLLANLVVTALIIVFPQLVLWIPSVLME